MGSVYFQEPSIEGAPGIWEFEDALRYQALGKWPWDVPVLFANGKQGAWYDPSDLSTLFQDAAGTVPVTADGQPVGLTLDKRFFFGRTTAAMLAIYGSILAIPGNHASQPVLASCPTYRTDGMLHWLKFDGVDDFLVTNAFAWGSDEVTILAGQEKFGAVATAMMVEFSANANTNNGIFNLYSPRATNDQRYQAVSKGSAVLQVTSAVHPAPHKAVLASLGKIGSGIIKLRVNRTETEESGGQGTTSAYGNYELYIGRRGGGTLPWNGNLYGLILRNALTAGADLTNVEAWLAAKTGVVI